MLFCLFKNTRFKIARNRHKMSTCREYTLRTVQRTWFGTFKTVCGYEIFYSWADHQESKWNVSHMDSSQWSISMLAQLKNVACIWMYVILFCMILIRVSLNRAQYLSYLIALYNVIPNTWLNFLLRFTWRMFCYELVIFCFPEIYVNISSLI